MLARGTGCPHPRGRGNAVARRRASSMEDLYGEVASGERLEEGGGRKKAKRDSSLRRPTLSEERKRKKKSACFVRNDGVG